MSQTAQLARSLARPVVRGWMPWEHAEAAVALSIAREPAEGTAELGEVLNVHLWLLRNEVERQEIRRDLVAHQMSLRIWPLLDSAKPIGMVRAAAHDINGDHGFAFSEPEVEQLIVDALHRRKSQVMAQAGPPPVRRRRPHHG